MNLKEVIEKVRDRKLSKDELEQYRDSLAELFALMKLEISDIEKEEALFLVAAIDESHVARKRAWKATTRGLRQIELDNYLAAVAKMIDSLKSRLYSVY